jgi:hypothetical protein
MLGRLVPLVAVCGLALTVARAESGSAPGHPLETLESLVGQWSDLRLTLAEEERGWEEQRRYLVREIDLLRKEQEVLGEALRDAADAGDAVDEEHLAQLRARDRLQEILEALPPMIDLAEASLRAWPARLPPALRVSLDPAFRLLLDDDRDARGTSYGARLQRVVALYGEIEKLQNNIHVVKELLPVGDGVYREVDVCYLGLARAFAVSADDDWAAVGTPSDQGWVWEERVALAPRVRQAIAVCRREREVDTVILPLAVQGEAR